MFGLWYLSLAISEIKRHFGWTSLFDVFKTNKTGNVKAIENAGPATSTLPQVKKEEPPKKTPVTVSPKVPDPVPPKPEPKKNDVSLPQPPAPKKEETNKPSVTIPSKPVELRKPKEVTPPSPKIDDFKVSGMKQTELPKVPSSSPESPRQILPTMDNYKLSPESPKLRTPPRLDEYKKSSSPSPDIGLPKLETPPKLEDLQWSSPPTSGLPINKHLLPANDPRKFAPETNGFDAPKPTSNIRDATTSLLQEEGKSSVARQLNTQS